MAIDPSKPIVAYCGTEQWPAEITSFDAKAPKPWAIARIAVPHRLRLGEDLWEPNSWNFQLADGKWTGTADIHIKNK